ncbi:MAG: hypothetical protein J2P36_28580 [Ktedonobacteraceae bacterium]|nr:hypothetical protein [Ktedonobacteraceae bacterium]
MSAIARCARLPSSFTTAQQPQEWRRDREPDEGNRFRDARWKSLLVPEMLEPEEWDRLFVPVVA